MLEIKYAPGFVCVCQRDSECVPQSLCVKLQTTVQVC